MQETHKQQLLEWKIVMVKRVLMKTNTWEYGLDHFFASFIPTRLRKHSASQPSMTSFVTTKGVNSWGVNYSSCAFCACISPPPRCTFDRTAGLDLVSQMIKSTRQSVLLDQMWWTSRFTHFLWSEGPHTVSYLSFPSGRILKRKSQSSLL